MFQQAFRLLLSLATGSAGHRAKKILIPKPEYFATIATICVHPNLTTRCSNQDDQANSTLALRLLETILKLAGPINSGLIEAYRFRKFQQVEDDSDEWRDSKLMLIYADNQNIFRSKDDFWDVLGWSLNCSCLSGIYAERWTYWKLWLDHILDTLERDWDMRENDQSYDQTLLWHYITSATGGNAAPRRMLRAIFADGQQKALDEFQLVFPRELKQRRDRQKLKKQEVVINIDEDIYGDWVQQSDSSSEEVEVKIEGSERLTKRLRPRTPSTRRKVSRQNRGLINLEDEDETSGQEDDAQLYSLGSPESISIRLRLLQLLSSAASHSQSQDQTMPNFPDLHDLFTLYVEFIRPLPLPIFASFVLPSATSSSMTSDARITLCEFIMQRIVDNTSQAKNRGNLQPMTQARLMQEYLPFSAAKNTIEMQAKLALLIESVCRILARVPGILKPNPKFKEAVANGIKQRLAKAEAIKSSRRYKNSVEARELEAFEVMEQSTQRLRFLLQNMLVT